MKMREIRWNCSCEAAAIAEARSIPWQIKGGDGTNPSRHVRVWLLNLSRCKRARAIETTAIVWRRGADENQKQKWRDKNMRCRAVSSGTATSGATGRGDIAYGVHLPRLVATGAFANAAWWSGSWRAESLVPNPQTNTGRHAHPAAVQAGSPNGPS